MTERLDTGKDSKEFTQNLETYVFIGPATSGKTAISNLLEKDLTANIVKVRGAEIVPDQAKVLSKTRQRVPDESFLPALENKLRVIGDGSVIFENIPRTVMQAKLLVDWASRSNRLLKVAVLHLGEDEVIDRAFNRWACPDCGATYHHELKPSQVIGRCDNDQNILIKKPGDSEENLRRQYKEYEEALEEMLPVLYVSENVRIIGFKSGGKTVEAATRVVEELRKVI